MTEHTVTKPTPADVGNYYDVMGHFFQTLWGDSVHFGFWPDPTDASFLMPQAQAAFTDLMIEQIGLQAGQRLLDVGCGTGQPAVQMAQKSGAYVTGITVSQSQVAAATARAQEAGMTDRVTFELVNAMEMPYADGTFDAAWAFESIFHMPSRVQVFREMARVVRPGGRVVVADFVTTRPMTEEEIQIVYPAFAVSEVGSLNDYINDLKAAGLTNIQCRDVTVNTIRPSNRATLAAMVSDHAQVELRAVYGDQQVDGFLGGWEAIRSVNETLTYIVLQAIKP
jgi:cyclopropane fatty-acyl-phospholipid synthase-like methyltransferase